MFRHTPKQLILEMCENRKKILLEIKTKVKTMLQGEHPSRYTGLGIEYDGIREYTFGDDYRKIEWSLTARTPPRPDGESLLFIKQYREEKNLNVLLILDQSGSMEYKSKVPTAIKSALVIADLAQRRSDKVGLVCFRDKVELFLSPTRSNEQAYRILRTLCQFYRTGNTSNLRAMAVEIVRALKKRSIVTLVTDINHDVGDYVYFARLMWASGHIINILLIVDESEINMPDVGWVTLTESERLGKITIDTSEFKKEYDSEAHNVLKGIVGGCTPFGAKILILKTPREVDARILEIAKLYRFAREGAYH